MHDTFLKGGAVVESIAMAVRRQADGGNDGGTVVHLYSGNQGYIWEMMG